MGPSLAAQFGYAPGFIWLVAGCCLAGAVHDFTVLWASTRRGGRSLAEIARAEIGPVAGTAGAIAVIFIVVIALAGLGIIVVNALAESAWGTFTIGMTIPLAIFMGFYMFKWRKGQIKAGDHRRRDHRHDPVRRSRRAGRGLLFGDMFVLSKHQLTVLLGVYGFAASVLPVWMLLTPRDYLSTFMKIGTIGLLSLASSSSTPCCRRRRFRSTPAGGGPIISRPALSVRLHHDRLRRDLRLPRADRLGHDAQDDR